MEDEVYKNSLALHLRHRGKLATCAKVKVENKDDLAVVYSPGVAEVARAIAADPQKSFSHTLRGNTVAVVSDGSAILGLGNLGAEAALPVMEGKALLFKQFAGVDAFPVCLNTQDDEEIVRAVKLIAPNFAGINLEDIAAPRCFTIEKRLQDELNIPVLHDDQHGTALVVLAGLLNALKVRDGAMSRKLPIVLSGAGAAGIAIATLLHRYGFSDITVCDSRGIVSSQREDLNDFKKELLRFANPRGLNGTLADALQGAAVFIGVSAGGIVNVEMVRQMAPRPVVFALANPTPEIMPDQALAAGALVVASGRSDFPNQINNVLAFPGIFRGAIDHGVRKITDEMLVCAAEALANLVETPTLERILPDAFDARVVPAVAGAIK